jgi:preprotein translocase subunit SecD
MFSAMMVSRGLVNLIYGSRRKLEQVAIGQVWKPATTSSTGSPATTVSSKR